MLRRAAAVIVVLASFTGCRERDRSTAAIEQALTVPGGFSDGVFASGLDDPTAMAFAPDGRLFVSEQKGTLRVIKNGVLLPTPFATLTVDNQGERGLLGVAFDPAFASNGFVYVYKSVDDPNTHNRISRLTAAGDVAMAGSEVVIFAIDGASSGGGHNGGGIHFGIDGKLYAGVGDNGGSENGQDLGNLRGKLLRINPDGSIPGDNPFLATTTGKNQAIWALGLRQPYSFAVDPTNGRIFINDVGSDQWEEINEGGPGANFGWPDTEGDHTDPRYQRPVFAYANGPDGCAITGGVFYRPPVANFPLVYEGNYFFADHCKNYIRYVDPDSGADTDFATGSGSLLDLAVGPDGALYYLARYDGNVGRITAGADEPPAIGSQPADLTITVGSPATFAVGATGTPPLSYRWRRDGADIAGADESSYTIAATTLGDDGATFDVVVSNGSGSATSRLATLTVTTNTAPAVTIDAPAPGTTYAAGDEVAYAASTTDAEDGALPPAAFTWKIDFHHEVHIHPFIPDTPGATSGMFTVPTTGEPSADVWFRIHVTVVDSGGLTASATRDVVPRKSTISLATDPPGLDVRLDDIPQMTPKDVVGVEGFPRTLGVTSPQTLGATMYVFDSWSDGGAASHTIVTPVGDVTYTAKFVASGADAGMGGSGGGSGGGAGGGGGPGTGGAGGAGGKGGTGGAAGAGGKGGGAGGAAGGGGTGGGGQAGGGGMGGLADASADKPANNDAVGQDARADSGGSGGSRGCGCRLGETGPASHGWVVLGFVLCARRALRRRR